MNYSYFQAKRGRAIMWSHKIQSLWLDLKTHINMTCFKPKKLKAVDYIPYFTAFFLWMTKRNNLNMELFLTEPWCVLMSVHVEWVIHITADTY